MERPQKGDTYRHFKGHYYKILGTAKHSETQDKMVVYQEIRYDGDIWIRPLEMFVDIHPEHNIQRFKKINA